MDARRALFCTVGNKLYFDYCMRFGVGARCAWWFGEQGGGIKLDEWLKAGELSWRNRSLGKRFVAVGEVP